MDHGRNNPIVTDDPRSRIVLPLRLDLDTIDAARAVIQEIQPPEIGAYWIPASLFFSEHGGAFAVELAEHTAVILNLGLHDIPSQMAAALKNIDKRFSARRCRLGVTIHAESGISAIYESVRVGKHCGIDIIAHTKLPYAAHPVSGHVSDFYGHDAEARRIVHRMARLALSQKCQGVIIGWHELPFSSSMQEELDFAADQDCYAYVVPDCVSEDRALLRIEHAVRAGATRFILEWQPLSPAEGARDLGRELTREWPKSPTHKKPYTQEEA